MCDVGDKCGFGRNHILGNGVEHDAHIAADGNTASLRCRQKKRHVDVTEIDHVQDASAGRENLAWLSDTILHPPIARRFQNGVVDVGGNAFYRGPCRVNGGIRVDNLGLGGADGGFGSGKLGLRRADGGLRALLRGLIVIEDLLRDRVGLDQPLRSGKFLLCGVQLRFALSDDGNRSIALSFALPDETLGRVNVDDGAVQLGLRLPALSLQLLGVHAGEHLAG